MSLTALQADNQPTDTKNRQKYAFHGLPAQSAQERPFDTHMHRELQKATRQKATQYSKRHFADQKDIQRAQSRRMRLREAKAKYKTIYQTPSPN